MKCRKRIRKPNQNERGEYSDLFLFLKDSGVLQSQWIEKKKSRTHWVPVGKVTVGLAGTTMLLLCLCYTPGRQHPTLTVDWAVVRNRFEF
jgi:hypothetical protein